MFKFLKVLLGVCFLPITFIYLIFKGIGKNSDIQETNDDGITMNEIVDYEDLMEE